MFDIKRFDIMYGVRKFFRKIKEIIKWIPVLWKDEQWDGHYLYLILRHKLALMEKFFNSDKAMTTSAQKDAKKMRICILLLDRLIKDDYYILAGMDGLGKKWGKCEMVTSPVPGKDGYHSVDFKIEKVKTKEDREKYNKDFNTIVKKEAILGQQDRDYLFDTLKKYITGWWD